MKMRKDQRIRLDKDNRDQRGRDHDGAEHDNNGDFTRIRKIEGFASSDDNDIVNRFERALKSLFAYDKQDLFNQGVAFCVKVKERLCSSDDYHAFLKFLHIYSITNIKRNELQNLVGELLGKHSDLVDEFKLFFDRCENVNIGNY